MPRRLEFLSNRYLRITPRAELNDPYDFRPFESDLQKRRDFYDKHPLGPIKFSHQDIVVDYHLYDIGVVSFTEAIDNLLMWSHYANSHRGMAVGFDPKHEFFESLDRVRYTTQRPDLHNEFPNINAPELFFKSDQWSYEKEWRPAMKFSQADCMVHAKDGPILEGVFANPRNAANPQYPNLAMLQVPPDAIRSVTFGCRSSEVEIAEFLTALAAATDLSHVTCQQVTLHSDKYELGFRNMPE